MKTYISYRISVNRHSSIFSNFLSCGADDLAFAEKEFQKVLVESGDFNIVELQRNVNFTGWETIRSNEPLVKIRLTTQSGVTYPEDLQNLTYDKAVEQIELLAQKTGFEDWELDRRGEDAICLSHTDGGFSLYEIVDADE